MHINLPRCSYSIHTTSFSEKTCFGLAIDRKFAIRRNNAPNEKTSLVDRMNKRMERKPTDKTTKKKTRTNTHILNQPRNRVKVLVIICVECRDVYQQPYLWTLNF